MKIINKRFICMIISVILILSSGISLTYAEKISNHIYDTKKSFDINAKSSILIDSKSGNIIYAKNENEKLSPASITKIMVMLIAMEDLESKKISLEDEVTVSEKASKMGGSQVFLEENEVQTVENLLKAIALRSANDASVALGEYLSGSLDLFIERMNTKAKQIGMNNTNFENPTGLPDENHYSTSYDISLMSRELMKYPKINTWLTMWMDDINVGKNKDIVQNMVNTNKMIRFYEGANGIKTGYTNDAGFCLSSSAKRGNLNLISVVLGCETSQIRFDESRKLLDYGFANYDSLTVNKKNDAIAKIPVSKGNLKEVSIVTKDDLSILLKKGQSGNVKKKIQLPKLIEAPIKKNQQVGELIVLIDDKEVGKVKLVSSDNIKKASFNDLFNNNFKKIISK